MKVWNNSRDSAHSCDTCIFNNINLYGLHLAIMSVESENNPLLDQPLMSNEPEQNVLVPQEYVDDEKGKMNTLEVAICAICYPLVLHQLDEGYCRNGFIGPAFCIQSGVHKSLFCNVVGRYHLRYSSVCRCLRNDDSGDLAACSAEQGNHRGSPCF